MKASAKKHETKNIRELQEILAAERREKSLLVKYVREKVDQLLNVMGTSPINPHELDDQTLLELDPIGIICGSFSHVLNNLEKTNEELALARDEIETIFDTAGAAIMVVNPQREIIAYNRKVDDFFLKGEHDVLGRDCRDVVCKDNFVHAKCAFERVVDQGLSDKNLEWSLGNRSFDVVGKPIRDPEGHITHVVLSYNDISDRKRSMLALRDALLEAREAKNRIKGILRSVEDAVIVTDHEGTIQLMNETAERLLSGCRNPGEFEAGFPARLHGHLLEGRNASGLWVSDLKLVTEEGSEKIYQARSSLIPQDGAERGGVVTLLQEVTREREIEQLKSDFVSTAAHELRTPLSTILGFSELILNEENVSLEDMQEYIGIIHHKAEGLSQIVNNLLDISRIESGEGLQLDLERCSVKELCQDALLGFTVQGKQYTFDIVLPGKDIYVQADRFAMAQVLENILSNAVKYSPQHSVITLEAQQTGEEVFICVSDQGIGMSEEEVARVFDKFFRADASNTAAPGTGLGMTIVKHIVEAHGGRVWVESPSHKGCRVCFTLQHVE